MSPVTASQLMTRRQAAEALAISIRTLDELTRTGDLAHVKMGRCVRFRRNAINDFIEANEMRRNPRAVRNIRKGGAS